MPLLGRLLIVRQGRITMNHSMRLARSVTLAGPSRYIYRSFSASRIICNAAPLTQSKLEFAMREGLKSAMKARDKPAVALHKAILADVTNAAKQSKNPNDPLPESAVITAIRKGIAMRREAAASYAPDSPGSHPENYSNLQSEISALESYLPSSPSIESIASLAADILRGLSEDVRSGRGVQGSVMKTLWAKLGDGANAVDRKEVGKMVSEMLNGKK